MNDSFIKCTYNSLQELIKDTNANNFIIRGLFQNNIIKKVRADNSIFYQYILEDKYDSIILRTNEEPSVELINNITNNEDIVFEVIGYITTITSKKKNNKRIYNIKEIKMFKDENLHDLLSKNINIDFISLKRDYHNILNTISNTNLIKVINRILHDYKDFFIIPAGITIHHNYKYGLLEHSVNIAKLAIKVYEIYNNKNINKDILIVGALLHDIGKVNCYTIKNNIPLKKIQINTFNHIASGYYIVKKYLDEEIELSNEIKDNITHIILSHHGDISKGSPVLPMTIEAIIVSELDSLDANSNSFLQVINSINSKNNSNISDKKRYLHRSIWNGKYFNDDNNQIILD